MTINIKKWEAFVDNLSRKIFISWRWHLIADAKW